MTNHKEDDPNDFGNSPNAGNLLKARKWAIHNKLPVRIAESIARINYLERQLEIEKQKAGELLIARERQYSSG